MERTGRSRGGDQGAAGDPLVGYAAAADHPYDLDLIAMSKRHGFIRRSLDDGPVVLDSDGARVDVELLQVGQQRSRALELDLLAVDQQRNHRPTTLGSPPPGFAGYLPTCAEVNIPIAA